MTNKKINKNDVKRSKKLKKDTHERIMFRVRISHGISQILNQHSQIKTRVRIVLFQTKTLGKKKKHVEIQNSNSS